MKFQDVADGRERLELHEELKHMVRALAFSPAGKLLAAACGDRWSIVPNVGKLWDAASGTELATLKGHGDPVTAVAFSPDGKLLATASSARSVKLWEVPSGREVRTLPRHAAQVNAVAFSP